ncbi:related to glyoxal oxidase precursor [Serendipita indica DSM 11827]|uniref:Related to glyoxal oxidase n=1 Tax=Serendipita indica (strain DSM 11827) TaxID=1109443 RepID=G4T6S3_SERID|nr:related to glyoxal oxidase precursor [Serendipita indica DSM 11827]
MLATAIPLISSLVLATSVRAAPSTVSVYNGWLSAGCFEDSINARVLPNQRYPAGGPSAMTVELCVDACRADGFSVAGLEWAQECWCGDDIPSNGAQSCDMACKGNPNEHCGGGNRINVYQYSNIATYNDWTFDNCYTDSIWNRVLPNQLSVSGGMTIEKCLDACDAAGYAFGGVEWGKECWCGNTGPTEIVQDQRCDTRCEGDSSELCGGGNGLSVYHNSNPKGPSNLPSYKDWTYDNCFVDSRWNRVLPQQLSISGPMTIESV